jgi:hypothetical protein
VTSSIPSTGHSWKALIGEAFGTHFASDHQQY